MSDSDKIKDFIDDSKKAGIRTLMPSAAVCSRGRRGRRRGDPLRLGAKGTGRAAGHVRPGRRCWRTKELGFHEMITAVDPHDGADCVGGRRGAFDELGHNRGAARRPRLGHERRQPLAGSPLWTVVHVRRLRRRRGARTPKNDGISGTTCPGRGARPGARGPRPPLRAPLSALAPVRSDLDNSRRTGAAGADRGARAPEAGWW